MEAVIALPLFMLLIGGILWLGQLSSDRQKLVVADRYVAWNYGNRHGATFADSQTRFFDKTSQFDKVKQTFTGKAKSDGQWWRYVCGAVTLTAEMPSWTHGWISADAIMKGRSSVLRTQTGEFAGRYASGQTVGGHYVVMRRSEAQQDTRDQRPSVNTDPLGINYQQIFEEAYPIQ